MIKKHTFSFTNCLTDIQLIGKLKNHIANDAATMFFFGSFHTKLNLLLYVSEILLKLSENPRDWQRISFMLYKEFNQTEKVRTQLYLIISDILR